MKIKISIVFAIISIVVLAFILRPQWKVYFPDKEVKVTKEELTNVAAKSFLSNEAWMNYAGVTEKISADMIEGADIVVVHLWASWCAPCVNEVPELIDFAKKTESSKETKIKVVFITVSLDDSKDDIAKFIKSFPEFDKNPFIRVWDYDKRIAKFFSSDRLPMTVVINKAHNAPRIINGVVEWKHVEL